MVARWDALLPTSPAHIPRYDTDRTKLVTPGWQNISPGLYTSVAEPEPRYLPASWSSYLHPEGDVYFARASIPRIVTRSDIYSAEAHEEVEAWAQIVIKAAAEENVTFTSSMEVYLEVLKYDDFDCCKYYIADHTTCTIFWLEEVNSSAIGVIQTVSGDHIRFALEGLFWLHVETHPCHSMDGQNLSLNELIDIYAQAQTDHSTSLNATFPRNAKDCKVFVKTLRHFREAVYVTPHARWTIARLWGIVANYRALNHHGQAVPRLSIDQQILALGVNYESWSQQGWAYRLVSKLMFGFPTTCEKRLETVWTDEIVNVHHWRSLIEPFQAEWKACLIVGLALLITNVLITMSPMMTSPIYSGISILLSNAAVLSAMFLLVRFHTAHTYSAGDAVSFLQPAGSDRSDFRITSIQFSLPKALLIWTLAASTLQILSPLLGGRVVCLIIASWAVLLGALKARDVCVSLGPRLLERFGWARKEKSEGDGAGDMV